MCKAWLYVVRVGSVGAYVDKYPPKMYIMCVRCVGEREIVVSNDIVE